MHRQALLRPSAGFTLVELAAVLAIAGVLIALAAPVARPFLAPGSMSAFANAFLSHLQLARSEAIKRRGPVVMCKSWDGQTCAATGGWEQGWIVFHDANANTLREPGEHLIQKSEALPSGLRLDGNLNVSRYVSFTASGATRTSSGAFQAGTLTLCPVSKKPVRARQVILNAVGRPRLQAVDLPACT